MNQDRAALLQPLYNLLAARDQLSQDERQALLKASGDIRHYKAGSEIVHQGDTTSSSTLVVGGMTARAVTVEDGGRQITGLHIAGDFVDLHSLLLYPMDHAVVAINDCTTVSFPHERLRHITETMPHLTRLLWMVTLLDAAVHRQWLVAKGRLTAEEHMAHLFCELFVRSQIAGIAEGNRFALPLTQHQLSDALGLSIVHTNRVLQRLRRSRALAWSDGVAEVLNWALLREDAQFDPTFLNVEKAPR